MASIVVGTLRAILSLDSAQYEAGIRKMSNSADVFAKDAQKMGRAATNLGASLTKTVTLPLLALGGGAVKAAMDFETSFAGVKKTVQATEAEFAVMSQSLRNLAKQIPVNVNELNRLAEAAGAMGIPKAAIVDFSKTMALLGVTTNVTADQAAESIGKIQNIFGAAGKDTDRFAATLVALGNDGASTESQILEMATRIAGAGNVIGLTQGQVLGFASALSSVGLEAEAGGTAISRVFVDIAASVSKGGRELAQFANVAGMSTAAFSKAFKEDAAGAVLAFIEGLGRIKASGGDVLGTLAAMGIEEVRLRDTLLRAAGAGDLLRQSLDLQGKAWRENTALTIEAQKRFETTASQVQLLWNRVKDLAITIGNALLPMITSTVNILDRLMPLAESVAKAFGALPGPIQAVVVGLGLLVAAAGPVLWVSGQLITSWGLVAGAFGTGGLAARALALTMGPLALSVRAVTLSFLPLASAIAAVWVAWKIGNTETVKNSIASWALSADNLTAKLFRAVTGIDQMSQAEAKAAVQSHASAVASSKTATASASVATAVSEVTKALTASAPALDANLFKTEANTKASEKAAEAKLKEATAYRAFLNAVGEQEIHDIDASNKAREAADAKYRQFQNQLGEQEIADYGANIARKEADEKAWRDFQNEQGLRLMDEEAARLKQIQEKRQQAAAFWKQQISQLSDATVGQLGSLFFGNLGHDINGELKAAAQEAELDFLKIQRSGKATAEELSIAFERWREAEDRANFTFGERWKQMWGGIKQTFVSILNDMLEHFLKSFLGGLIKGMSSAKLAQSLGNFLMGGTAGAALGGGASLASGVLSNGVLTGVGAGGAAGAAPAAGAGIGLGATAALTGGAAGGALLAWAIWKKGLFRGGEESLKVSPRRDQFLAQFGGPGTGPDSGFHALAAKLTSITGQPSGGSLHASLRMADSVKEWESAQAAIVGALTGAGMKGIQSFALGGFVPPGVIQPAIVHGGAFGEDIIPRTSAMSGGANSRTVNFYATFQNLDPAGFERVFRKDILPRIKRATQFNTDDIAVMYGRVGASR